MKMHNKWKHSELWWLTPEEALKYKYTYVCYQEPYSDELNSERVPYPGSRFFSIDEKGNLSRLKKYYPIGYINDWRIKCRNINVFRGFGLSSSEHCIDKLFGPVILDVDREEVDNNKGYIQNLEEALEDTRRLVSEYLYKIRTDDFRIFFTGHKGFNVEVRPQALGIASISGRLKQFERIREDINGLFKKANGRKFIDKFHCEIRLHNSINRWIANDGRVKNRMKFELGVRELNGLTPSDICLKSESLASNYIKEGAV